jgi:hypothetical protein
VTCLIGAGLLVAGGVGGAHGQGERNFGQGNPSTTTLEVDSDFDAVPDSITTRIFTYDSSGREVLERVENDGNADGTLDQIQTMRSTYDARGNVALQTTDIDNGANGTVERRREITFTYDSRGNLVERQNDLLNVLPVPPRPPDDRKH